MFFKLREINFEIIMEGSILRDEDNIKELELKIESLQASVFCIN